MKQVEEYRIDLRSITDLAFSYGIQHSGIELSRLRNLSDLSIEDKEIFIQTCHVGYKQAQKRVIFEIQEYQTELTSLKINLKECRRNKNKTRIKEILNEQKIIDNRIITYSHIIDTIAWQILGSQIATVRRFHIDEKGSKFLNNSNISHAIEVADKINENPNNLALISDLTNFIQIGDLIVLQDGKVGVMELKEGAVNDQIAAFLSETESNNQTIEDVDLDEKFDKKTIKQIKRVVNQKIRMDQTIDVVNNDKGIDPVCGIEVLIKTPIISTEYYYQELEDLRQELMIKNWSYGVIDSCLHIGMYRGEGLFMAQSTIKSILELDTKNYILVDWSTITKNISEPIFNKPLPQEFIIDILTGKVKVIIGINLDLMIQLFNDLGVNASWMSRKETAKIKKEKIRSGLVLANNQGISMELPNGEKLIMYGGIISKMIYDNIRPSNIALTLANTIQERIESDYKMENNI